MQLDLARVQTSLAQLELDELELLAWRFKWLSQARDKQKTPDGDYWTTWLILAGRGFGKRLSVDTLLPTPTGFVLNGEIKAGDFVIGSTGNPVRVLEAHPIEVAQSSWRVAFDDGSYIDADGNHYWTTTSDLGTMTFTTHQVRETLHTGHSIPTVVLRGTNRALDAIPFEPESLPMDYLRSTAYQRRAIIGGQIGRDIPKDAIVDLRFSSKQLALDYQSMACSLGYKATVTGYDDFYLVTFDTVISPRTIVSITQIEPVAMRCITVDAEDGLYCAGREFILTHNTRTGAEDSAWYAACNENVRVGVLAPTSNDTRSVCFEGESGLLSVLPRDIIESYNKSLLEIKLKNGSLIKGYSAEEPSRLRGPQHHRVWCDELAAWQRVDEAWDMMKFGLRLGDNPQVVITTTPKPIDLLRRLVAEAQDDDSSVIMTTGSTYENSSNLARTFIEEVAQYEGTQLGRQELHAELLDNEENGIVKRSWFKLWAANRALPKFEYVIQSYDCATSDKTVNDPTACLVLGVFRPGPDTPMSVMVIDAWSEHLTYPMLRPKVIEEYESVYGDDNEFGHGKRTDLMLVEDKSAGISLIQDLQRAGLPVRGYNPGRADKTMRLNLVSGLIAKGRVYLPESTQHEGQPRNWCNPFLSQVCAFPNASHDDYVDALSQALRVLRDMGMIDLDPVANDDAYADDVPVQRQNPYAA